MERKLNLPNITDFGINQNKIKPAKRTNSSKRIFHFGKYRGKYINEVIKFDPQYVDWMRRENPQFKLTDDQAVLLAEYLDKYNNYIDKTN